MPETKDPTLTPEMEALFANALNIDPASDTLPISKVPKKKVGRKVHEKAANIALKNQVGYAIKDGSSILARNKKAYDDAFRNFENAVGGRTELQDVLKYCPPESPAYKALARLFKDEDFNLIRDVTLDVVCGRNKITLAQLALAWRDAKVVQMNVDTIARLAGKVPGVVDDTADDARNRYVDCPVCAGSTRIPRTTDEGEYLLDEDGEVVTQLCYNCKNTPGKVYKDHDSQSRKMFFHLTGLLKEGGKADKDSPTIQIANISGNFIPGDGSYEHLIKAIDRVAIPSRVSVDEDIDIIPNVTFEDETTPKTSDPASEVAGD